MSNHRIESSYDSKMAIRRSEARLVAARNFNSTTTSGGSHVDGAAAYLASLRQEMEQEEEALEKERHIASLTTILLPTASQELVRIRSQIEAEELAIRTDRDAYEQARRQERRELQHKYANKSEMREEDIVDIRSEMKAFMEATRRAPKPVDPRKRVVSKRRAPTDTLDPLPTEDFYRGSREHNKNVDDAQKATTVLYKQRLMSEARYRTIWAEESCRVDWEGCEGAVRSCIYERFDMHLHERQLRLEARAAEQRSWDVILSSAEASLQAAVRDEISSGSKDILTRATNDVAHKPTTEE
eukprot:PhF_6_TR36036/c0_g1_i2/m.52250